MTGYSFPNFTALFLAKKGDRILISQFHPNMDGYDHVVPANLRQASAVIASLVYHAATRPELLPRKELPPPLKLRN